MAATADKYSPETRNDKTNGEVYFFLPLALKEYLVASDNGIAYENMTDAQKKDDTGFRQKFFCDNTHKLKDLNGNDCVLGLVRENSDNYNHHNGNNNRRIGQGHMFLEANPTNNPGVFTDYIILNDGGLNTKPHAEFSGNILAAYTNFVKILCNVRSAYYLRTEYVQIKMTWTHNNTAQEYSWSLNFGTEASPTTILAAKAKLTQFIAKYKSVIGGLYAGDEITLQISANNDEGTYINTTTRTAIVKGAMNFIEIYKVAASLLDVHGDPNWSDPTKDPTDPANYDARYALLASDDMFNAGGALKDVFDMPSGDYAPNISSNDYLKGMLLNSGQTIEDAYDSTPEVIPDGWYFGVPKPSLGSSTLVLIKINTVSTMAKRMAWHGNVYVESNYTVTLVFSGTYDWSTGIYTINLAANISGSYRSGTTITVYIYDDTRMTMDGPAGNLVRTITKTITSSHVVMTANTDSTDAPITTSDDTMSYMAYNSVGSPAPSSGNPIATASINVSDIDTSR